MTFHHERTQGVFKAEESLTRLCWQLDLGLPASTPGEMTFCCFKPPGLYALLQRPGALGLLALPGQDKYSSQPERPQVGLCELSGC